MSHDSAGPKPSVDERQIEKADGRDQDDQHHQPGTSIPTAPADPNDDAVDPGEPMNSA